MNNNKGVPGMPKSISKNRAACFGKSEKGDSMHVWENEKVYFGKYVKIEHDDGIPSFLPLYANRTNMVDTTVPGAKFRSYLDPYSGIRYDGEYYYNQYLKDVKENERRVNKSV